MIIKRLELVNFQVIEKFEADFNGNVYLITGDNELGKSTLLKAIGALLTGNRDEVLRNGATKGFAKMVVGDDGEEYDVSLSFTENNPRGTLTIKQKSNGMQTNNISMLQRIFGYQDFDAVEFSRWSETAEGRRKQIAVVKALLPPDVRTRIETIDTTVAELKQERTGINRDVKTLGNLFESAKQSLGTNNPADYEKPIDVAAMLEQQKVNAQLIEKAKTAREKLALRTEQLAAIPERLDRENARYDNEIAAIDSKVEAARIAYEKAKADAEQEKENSLANHRQELQLIDDERKDIETKKANAEDWLRKYELNNPEKNNTADMLAKAEKHNEIYKIVQDCKQKESDYNNAKAKAEQMDADITKLSDERAGLIANAKLPIDGLTFTDDGLELNGVPFMPGKVSDSQTMEIAAKLIIASNPTVKVFRIARGESLGAKRLEAIIKMARENGFQGFIEQVQRGQNEMMVEEYNEQ